MTNATKVALTKLKPLSHAQGAQLLQENGYQMVGQHGYPQQQTATDDLQIYYYSEHQYQAWDNQANPLDHKLYTAVYQSIDDYIQKANPLSGGWSNLAK